MHAVDFYITECGFTHTTPDHGQYIHVMADPVHDQLARYQIVMTAELVDRYHLDQCRYEVELDRAIAAGDLIEVIDELSVGQVNDLFDLSSTDPDDLRFSYGLACLIIWREFAPEDLLESPFNDYDYRGQRFTLDSLRAYRTALRGYIPTDPILAKVRDGVFCLLHLHCGYLVKSNLPTVSGFGGWFASGSVGALVDVVYQAVVRRFQSRLTGVIEEARQHLHASLSDIVNRACRFQLMALQTKVHELENRIRELENATGQRLPTTSATGTDGDDSL